MRRRSGPTSSPTLSQVRPCRVGKSGALRRWPSLGRGGFDCNSCPSRFPLTFVWLRCPNAPRSAAVRLR